MIKAITFDLDGVYFVNGKSNFISNIVKLGVSEDEAKRVFLKSDEMNNLYKAGKMTDEEYWTWAKNEWKLNKSAKELMELLVLGYEVDQNVVETVKNVRANGYKTLICTNNFPARINGLQNRFKFLDDFDGKSISYEVGSSKPDSKIYQKLIEVSGVNANEIVYADDNNDNILEAQKLGINAFFYENFDGFIEELRKLGVNI
jgi:putative hydrolase of the HAD superfamily